MDEHDTHIWEKNNPHMGRRTCDNPICGMIDKEPLSARALLAANLAALMEGNPRFRTSTLIESATSKRIGHSTVDRIRAKSTNATIDNVELLGELFGLQAWQMLHPHRGEESSQPPSPSVTQALQIITEQLSKMNDEARRFASTALQDLMRSPDSLIQLRAALNALGELPADLNPAHRGKAA
ncbi:hypothetical protein [Variovorax sp. DAIF25]|uniref:hypothetical protein n=1 Tax=Variovorax sp. DAIF25 TaxID=3080983 RepID=UPI003D6AEB13